MLAYEHAQMLQTMRGSCSHRQSWCLRRGMRGDEARKLCAKDGVELQLVQVPTSHGKADLTLYRQNSKQVLLRMHDAVVAAGLGSLVAQSSKQQTCRGAQWSLSSFIRWNCMNAFRKRMHTCLSCIVCGALLAAAPYVFNVPKAIRVCLALPGDGCAVAPERLRARVHRRVLPGCQRGGCAAPGRRVRASAAAAQRRPHPCGWPGMAPRGKLLSNLVALQLDVHSAMCGVSDAAGTLPGRSI